MEKISYYTTCESCEELTGIATVLEGLGDYDRDENSLETLPCSGCGETTYVHDWFDECEECLELHYGIEECPTTTEEGNN